MEVCSSGLLAILLLASVKESVGKKLIDDPAFLDKIKPLAVVFLVLVGLLIIAVIILFIAYRKNKNNHSLEYKDSSNKSPMKKNASYKYSYDNHVYEDSSHMDLQEVKKVPLKDGVKEKEAFDNPVYQNA